jgi:hypothetical protein
MSRLQHLRAREIFFVVGDDDLVGRQSREREMFNEVKRALARRDPYREPNGPQVVADVLRRWGIEGGEHTLAVALFEALRDDDDLEEEEDE